MEQKYQTISIDTWERCDFFHFFNTFNDPNISVSSDIECTGLIQTAKSKHLSPYLSYLHIIHTALNKVENLRYRLVDNEVRLYNFVNFEVYICPHNSTLPRPVLIEWNPDFDRYYHINSSIITHVKQGNVDKQTLSAHEDTPLVSSTPNLYFTSIKHAAQSKHNSRPLINTGKVVKRGQKEFMPVAITVTHAFVDGLHIQQFFDLVHIGFKSFVNAR